MEIVELIPRRHFCIAYAIPSRITLSFHGIYSKQAADKLLKQTYSVLGNKTENTLSLQMIIHSFRIFPDVKSHVRLAKSEIYFTEAPYLPAPISSLSAVQFISFNICESSQLAARKYSPLIHAPPVPVAARSKVQVYGRSHAAILSSNSTGDMDVCLLCVLSGRSLCDGLITRPEESYRLWRVVVCDQKTS
jgi:hypothetical protein